MLFSCAQVSEIFSTLDHPLPSFAIPNSARPPTTSLERQFLSTTTPSLRRPTKAVTAVMAGLDSVLDQPHRDFLDSALGNVLGTERALETYAQIVDGLPLASVVVDRYGDRHEKYPNHPIARHTSLCPGATETARAFLAQFTVSGTLSFDDEVGQRRVTSTFRLDTSTNPSAIEIATPGIPVDTTWLGPQLRMPSYRTRSQSCPPDSRAPLPAGPLHP
jgi:hypothetical protein